MVRDGYFYGSGFILAAGFLDWLVGWPFAVPALLLAFFFLWFFRDPERQIPSGAGIVVSPGDGKVTDVVSINSPDGPKTRVSIFLSVFDVHVNRAPITGVITDIRYQRGKFLNAMGSNCVEENEQNIVTVEGEGRKVVFKQIAGLLARRIVFEPKLGDTLVRGQRVGLIKFGSRVDLIVDGDAAIQVKVGDRVKGGATVVAVLKIASQVAPALVGQAEAG
jgi:phosphatidylserine decarboxylase